MTDLELLAPARNADIGIAAIDCGADAVYIAGPNFGARKDAGNPIEDIARLCTHAHKYGARIFVTFNILVREDELPTLHKQMLEAQAAGADAFIVRDLHVCSWKDITVPLHASTQCSIMDLDRARLYEKAGCSRLVLERQLSLEQIREISSGVDTEIEFFVHGALCTGYSGQCTLSEYLNGRSADRGECIQACRSLYSLYADGELIAKDVALLSLKDYQLIDRLEDLADAGVSSFKIEGRLKGASYVKNVVRAYSLALDKIIEKRPAEYRRASFGRVVNGFTPDTEKTFNRGYTELFLDGKRSEWGCGLSSKTLAGGEKVGRILRVTPVDKWNVRLLIENPAVQLSNGDGLCFVNGSQLVGVRADVCQSNSLVCKKVDGLKPGVLIYRNISARFEKELENAAVKRMLDVAISASVSRGSLELHALSEDGRQADYTLDCSGFDKAMDRERAIGLIQASLGKSSADYQFRVENLRAEEEVALIRSAEINAARRELAQRLDDIPCIKRPMRNNPDRTFAEIGSGKKEGTVMRSKYCIRYALNLCTMKNHFVLSNCSHTFSLQFNCKDCEMSVIPEQK